jgi:Flp pilus assembly protein TadG
MKSHVHHLGKPTPKQTGLVAILFVAMLPFLLGLIALAFDVGQLFIVKTELQNATDACAISAGAELNGTSAQFTAAEAAGILAGTANKVNLQKVAVSMANNSAVTFAQNLNDASGSYITAATGSALSNASAANYRYVRCSASSAVTKLLNIPGSGASDTITAQAIASRVPIQSPCVLPIGVCSNANAVTTNTVGAWISGEIGKNDPCVGNVNCYKWVVYNGATPNASNLANLLTGNNSCGITLTGQSVTEFSGAAASPYDEYNTRFGVQKGTNPVNPDFTGYGYTPATHAPATTYSAANSLFAINAHNNYVTKKTALAPYQNVPNLPGYTTVPPTALNAKARRIGVVPVIPCTGGTSSVNNWACVLMLNPIASGGGNKTLYLEYLGSSSAGACTEIGYAGSGSGPTVSALVQ